MKINTNIQQFSSLSGIKVTQNSNTSQNKNSEAVNINIDSKTLDTLNLLSSLNEETILKAYDNSYINPDMEALVKKLEEHYKKTNEENKKFPDPSNHIWNKYNNPKYEYYAKEMNDTERKISFEQEKSQLNGKYHSFRTADYHVKDMKAIYDDVDVARQKAYYRDKVNEQFSQLLDRYGIEIPKDTNISFTIDPYDYKVSVSGIEDKSLASLLEDVLNTADNSKELFTHIYKSSTDNNSQITLESNEKSRIFHEIKDKTGYDLRDLENVDGKFLTPDGTDILEIYKEAMIKSDKVPEEYKGLLYEFNAQKLQNVAQKGFLNVPDMVLSIDYKNGSFYDIGQNENFGVGKRDWIDKLDASKPQTWKEANKSDSITIGNKQGIIKEALNLNTLTLDSLKSEAKGLFEEYGTSDFELIKLILMQKYLMDKEDSQADKEFYKLLKEWKNEIKISIDR
ncbi:DUF4885 family protein [Aliarcobacter skirrowii]|uniref:DUF4885 family protein n=1 Tax=Aliarcobacter skirrowii TaxID=28200 RepID=UPI0029A3F369|nr:DUF4885 family protein [Aliarcobacter skirrowii]MDX4012255.1 DUF4885 family protein [Aliarcobacter skirrowii]